MLKFITNPYVLEAWQRVRQELSNSDHKDMVDFIDKLILIKDEQQKWFNELKAVQPNKSLATKPFFYTNK